VATAFGVLVALSWPVGVAVLGTWLLMAAVFKISSLAALTAALLTPVYVWYLDRHSAFVMMTIIMTAILFWRHRSNIKKLIQGKESRIRGQ
jgi:glycerol-3-phosphate acyltransferase PlsY